MADNVLTVDGAVACAHYAHHLGCIEIGVAPIEHHEGCVVAFCEASRVTVVAQTDDVNVMLLVPFQLFECALPVALPVVE